MSLGWEKPYQRTDALAVLLAGAVTTPPVVNSA
jgi:hypothetical protein